MAATLKFLSNVKFVPPTSFTVEAWVRLDWTADDPSAFRFVLDMREFSPVTTGFANMREGGRRRRPGYISGAGSSETAVHAFIFSDSIEALVMLNVPAATAAPKTPIPCVDL